MADPAGDRGPVPGAFVALHPEAVPDDERALRWVMPAGTLDLVGTAAAVPGPLQTLLDDATLEGVRVEPTAVWTRLAVGRRWRAEGPRVRRALHAALARPEGWAPAAGSSPDDRLRMAVEEVVAGDVGAYIRSHGGRIEVVHVHQDRVEIRLSGACTHCPASDLTLSSRFESAVRARYPDLAAATLVDTPATPRTARLLGLPRRRR